MPVTLQPFIVPVGMEHLAAEIQFVQEHWDALMMRYAGQYIAVMGNNVVSANVDDVALAQQIYSQFGNARFYIAEVSDVPTVYHV